MAHKAPYIASWATTGDFECFQDVPGEHAESIADLANPTGVILTSLTEAKIAKVKEMVYDYYCEEIDYYCEEIETQIVVRWTERNSIKDINNYYTEWVMENNEEMRDEDQILAILVIRSTTVV